MKKGIRASRAERLALDYHIVIDPNRTVLELDDLRSMLKTLEEKECLKFWQKNWLYWEIAGSTMKYSSSFALAVVTLLCSWTMGQDPLKMNPIAAEDAQVASDNLNRLLEQEAAFPKLYAALSQIQISSVGNGNRWAITATQRIVIDEKHNRWTAYNIGRLISDIETKNFGYDG